VPSEQALHQNFKAQHGLRAAAAQLTKFRHRENLFGGREARVEEEGIDVGGAKQFGGELSAVPGVRAAKTASSVGSQPRKWERARIRRR
jgi:hypothetical protein